MAMAPTLLLALAALLMGVAGGGHAHLKDTPYNAFGGLFDSSYASFPEQLRLETLDLARSMFTTGYDCYMKCAFPMDELDPIHCKGIK